MQACTSTDKPTSNEVADIFRLYGQDYRRHHGMTGKQHAVMRAIENCRTAAYGYHIDQCNACGHMEQAFNSCRDRHGPKCQAISRKKWVAARMEAVLPVPYYHVVFTLPHRLHPLTGYNQALIYDLLFTCASQTLLSFGRDPKWLGGKLGFYGVLHTWGQKLWRHPHVHFIVAGGALSRDNRWVAPRYRQKFLFPVAALSKVFRGKFIQGLKQAFVDGDLRLPPALGIVNEKQFERWLNKLVSRNWVVYCKAPFSHARQVIDYLARYTHRVAISNARIMAVTNGCVRFRYKDYRAGAKAWKTMTLTAAEFIRHYGFLANGCCKAAVSHIRQLLERSAQEAHRATQTIIGKCCSVCGKGILVPLLIKDGLGRIVSMCASNFKNNYLFDTS